MIVICVGVFLGKMVHGIRHRCFVELVQVEELAVELVALCVELQKMELVECKCSLCHCQEVVVGNLIGKLVGRVVLWLAQICSRILHWSLDD